jgi:hypothetical protein
VGLDNIPKKYACDKQNIAIFNKNGTIDCVKTQAIGHCPFYNLKSTDIMVKDIEPVYGILGLECWYRGKHANHMLSIMDQAGYISPIDFYGDSHLLNGTPPGLSPAMCLTLSDWMNQHTEVFAKLINDSYNMDSALIMIKDWIYASWWLTFVANYCNGSDVWY